MSWESFANIWLGVSSVTAEINKVYYSTGLTSPGSGKHSGFKIFLSPQIFWKEVVQNIKAEKIVRITEKELRNLITILQVTDQDTKLDQIVVLVSYNDSRYLQRSSWYY